MIFKDELKKRVQDANKIIEKHLPKSDGIPGSLVEAMNYSVLAGGKRLRPIMMQEVFKLFGGEDEVIESYMAAMEIIHTSSLVHDDLPAIDDDLFRRGKKTTHAQYGEAMGVLAGDALLNYAYELLFSAIIKAEKPENAAKAAKIIGEKTGYKGMLGGQAVDVEHEKTGIKGDTLELLNYIYIYKTSALFAASMMAGAALAGADDENLNKVERIATLVGLAFQIMDDVLDVTATTEILGKPVLSDEKNKKDTYVSIIGVEAAVEKVNKYTEEAEMLLAELPGDISFLKELIRYLSSREK